MSASVEVRLLGQRITLRSGGDPARAEEVAALVSRLLEGAESRLKGAGQAPHLVTLLALMELAEEYLQARERVREYQSAVAAKACELRKLLGNAEPQDS